MTQQQQADAFNARYKVGSRCRHRDIKSPVSTSGPAFVYNDWVVVDMHGVVGYSMISNLVMEDEG